MLDEREYQSISEGITIGVNVVQLVLIKEGRGFKKSDEELLYREVAKRYLEITGVSDVDYGDIRRHRLSLIGPPCVKCGKELRTPLARKCVECGHARD